MFQNESLGDMANYCLLTCLTLTSPVSPLALSLLSLNTCSTAGVGRLRRLSTVHCRSLDVRLTPIATDGL